MVRKFALMVLACMVVMSCFSPAFAAPTKENPMTLAFVSSWMESHPGFELGFKPWMAEIEAATDGRVTFDVYAANTLCSEREIFSCIEQGSADVGFVAAAKSPGRFPMGSIAELPMLGIKSSYAGSRAYWDLYNKYEEWQREYKGVKLLALYSSPPFELHMTKDFVKTRDDFKDLRLLSFSQPQSEYVRRLGGSAVSTIGSEVYMALERGMADGVINPMAASRAEKVTEVSKFTTYCGLAASVFYVAMNEETWAELGPELQQIIAPLIGDSLVVRMGSAMDQGNVDVAEITATEGQKFFTMPQEEIDKMYEVAKPQHTDWLKEMTDKGYDRVQVIYDDARALLAKYEAERPAAQK